MKKIFVSILVLLFLISFISAGIIMPGNDFDGDGVDDNLDLCANTVLGQQVNSDGCSIQQLCETNLENHGSYVSCIARTSKTLFLVPGEHGLMVSEAAQSDTGK